MRLRIGKGDAGPGFDVARPGGSGFVKYGNRVWIALLTDEDLSVGVEQGRVARRLSEKLLVEGVGFVELAGLKVRVGEHGGDRVAVGLELMQFFKERQRLRLLALGVQDGGQLGVER